MFNNTATQNTSTIGSKIKTKSSIFILFYFIIIIIIIYLFWGVGGGGGNSFRVYSVQSLHKEIVFLDVCPCLFRFYLFFINKYK